MYHKHIQTLCTKEYFLIIIKSTLQMNEKETNDQIRKNKSMESTFFLLIIINPIVMIIMMMMKVYI